MDVEVKKKLVEFVIAAQKAGTADPEFLSYVELFPKEHWARYDLGGVRLGWELHKVIITQSAENQK